MAITTTSADVLGPQISLPGCADRCGGVKVPYPFGISQGCFLSEKFYIHCDQSFQPPKPFLGRSKNNLPVSNITLEGGELVIMVYIGKDCYNKDGERIYHFDPRLRLVDFNIATDRNKFTAVGCDTYATLSGYRGEIRYVTGCVSYCNVIDDSFGASSSDQSCSGVGCCQTSIPSGLKNFTVSLTSYYNHTYVNDFNPCSYAFVVEESQFKFSKASFQELNSTDMVPMVLNWDIGKESCDEAKKRSNFTCKANSKCVDASDGSGYFCQCLPGYEGNPYHPNGCQDGYIASETGCDKVCGSSQSESHSQSDQSHRTLVATGNTVIDIKFNILKD
ncbi:hypothetical protein FNV43_RR06568 [Rhamnella rubrinervis]|uniref:EGF-like domain-containing protein n=1 Tax=Rhamnella rubrinervis TaxID=2594499 RepID=A0A8K0MM37_9ROSA|nr:hypothetical protein FNV43_RR06568 [Rhamnella rubrinervis]